MKVFLSLALLFLASSVYAAEPVTGLWTTIDDETNEPKSVVYVYESNGKIYGRVVKLFKNPSAMIKKAKTPTPIVGTDIIWDMTDTGNTFEKGQILDPKKGKVYTCEMWIENKNLVVRGKIGPFGRNQTWVKNTDITLIPSDTPTPKRITLD